VADPTIDDLYLRYFPMIRAKCERMLAPGEAEEVAQETFLRFWQRGPTHSPRAATAWLYRTSTRMAIDRLRRRRVLTDLSQVPAPGQNRAEARITLSELVRDHTPEVLTIVCLCRVDGMNQIEAGEVTGRSERTIRRILSEFDQRRSA